MLSSLAAIYFALPVAFEAATKYEKEILVEDMRTVRECSSIRFGFQRRFRSDTLPRRALGFCGHVETNVGAFKLPHSGELLTLKSDRKYLFDALKEGCTYHVEITGFGVRPQQGRPTRVPLQKTISRILREGDCV